MLVLVLFRARSSATILLTIPVLLLLLLVAEPKTMLGHGSYATARYTFLVTDPNGRPIEGVEFLVHGPRGEWPLPWLDEERPIGLAARGSWPIWEYDGQALRTDADGRVVVRQVPFPFVSGGYSLFGINFATGSWPEHTLEFRRDGYRSCLIDLDDLDRQAREGDQPVAHVEVPVLLEPHQGAAVGRPPP